jgi:hypothetical protein
VHLVNTNSVVVGRFRLHVRRKSTCEVVITSFCRRLRLPKSGGMMLGPFVTVSTLAASIFACPECLV